MGVKWLTSFVKRVERQVSSQDCFETTVRDESPRQQEQQQPAPTFVVDAWAFIFHIWLNHFGDAMRSLDYRAYQAAIQTILTAWQQVGITTVLVFDGPFLPAKLPKMLERRGGVAASNSAFIKSSPASRTSRRFQVECGVIAPLLLHATIDVVDRIKASQVEMIFAPTEADSLVAEIATEKERGYAVSLDSDFFILCARGSGCPYVPLDEIEYLVLPPASEGGERETQTTSTDSLDGFEQVGKRRKGARRNNAAVPLVMDASAKTSPQSRAMPPLPSDGARLQSVRVRAYRSQDLAAHLQIPPTLLPLLAALVGNDYTMSVQSNLLFRNLQGPARVTEAASILRSEWVRVTNESKIGLREATKAASSTRRGHSRLQMTTSTGMDASDDGKSETFSSPSSATATPTRNTPGPDRQSTATPSNVQDPVRAMVQVIVDKSLSQADAGLAHPRYITTGEKELIIESVIESAATYSLLTHSNAPHLASPSALFFGHPSSLMTSDTAETISSHEALERYRQAYAQGVFKENLIEAMTQRVFLATLSSEDTDVKSVQTTAARELRYWLWAILFEVWGKSWAREEWDEPAVVQEEGEEETGAELNGKGKFMAMDKGYKDGERPDDVISVDTDSSRSFGQEDDDGMGDLPSRPGSVAELRSAISKPAPGVVEYVRKGQLFVGDLVQILPLLSLLNGSLVEEEERPVDLCPSLAQLRGQHEASRERPGRANATEPASDPIPPAVVLMSLNVRLDLYLQAHRTSSSPLVHSLPRSSWPIVATLRLSIQHEAGRLGPSKRKLNWSKRELIAAIQSAFHDDSGGDGGECDVGDVQPSTRAIHLASTLQLLFETSYLLAQSLLLPLDAPNWPRPHSLYHGPTFHSTLAKVETDVDSLQDGLKDDRRAVLDAVLDGLHNDLGIDVSEMRKERKAKKKEAKSLVAQEGAQPRESSFSPNNRSQKTARNAFALLGDSPD